MKSSHSSVFESACRGSLRSGKLLRPGYYFSPRKSNVRFIVMREEEGSRPCIYGAIRTVSRAVYCTGSDSIDHRNRHATYPVSHRVFGVDIASFAVTGSWASTCFPSLTFFYTASSPEALATGKGPDRLGLLSGPILVY